jgi:hypothetical protein
MCCALYSETPYILANAVSRDRWPVTLTVTRDLPLLYLGLVHLEFTLNQNQATFIGDIFAVHWGVTSQVRFIVIMSLKTEVWRGWTNSQIVHLLAAAHCAVDERVFFCEAATVLLVFVHVRSTHRNIEGYRRRQRMGGREKINFGNSIFYAFFTLWKCNFFVSVYVGTCVTIAPDK